MREHLHMHCRRKPIFVVDQMFELPTQLLGMLLEIANVWTIVPMRQDDDDTDRDISNDDMDDPGESTLPSEIEEDDLDNLQEVVHLHQARHDKTLQNIRVSLPTTRSCADTVIAHTRLPNLRHPVRAQSPALPKCQESTMNISCKSDIVQALPLGNASGD